MQASYHAAYAYWNAKSILAERWAHGPHFGGWAEGPGDQLTLSPLIDAKHPDPPPLQALVGIKASGLLAERLADRDQVAKIGQDWLTDVYTALSPRRTVQLRVALFGLYPIRNPDQATDRLRSRFYVPDQVRLVVPERFRDNYHCALDLAAWDERGLWSGIVGVVGPPHKGVYFGAPDSARDESWWVGFNLTSVQENEDGIVEPLDELERMSRRLRADFDLMTRTVLPEVVG